MTKVEIDGKTFSYRILPCFGNKVYAEVYYKVPGSTIEVQVLNKEFGSVWRKPIERDYEKAKDWCENQLEWIQNANV